MNTSKSVGLFVLSLGLLSAPWAISAQSPEAAYVESYRGRSDIPVPISVVMPQVNFRHAGQLVQLVFVVDETGKISQLSFKEAVDSELAETLTAAVEQWRFAPARVDGRAVARRVLLPLKIIDGALSPADQTLAMK